jgi:histidyl-tRNA synthetase
VQTLRSYGVSTLADVQGKSFKSQMKQADKSGAKFTILIGENEVTNNVLTIKNMKTGEQQQVSDSIDRVIRIVEN